MNIALERGYRYEVTDSAIVLSSDSGSSIWTGGAIDSLIATLNDGGDHFLVVDFEHGAGTNWTLKTSVDGQPYLNHGTEAGCNVLAADSDPRVELTGVEQDTYLDEAIMWVNPTEFTSNNLADMFALGNAGQPLSDWEASTSTTAPPFVAHPADTGPGVPDGRCEPAEVLAYASVWLGGGVLEFQSTPLTGPGVAEAYILRAAAITLAHFQARYEDVGSAEPINSVAYPQRWQGLPDL